MSVRARIAAGGFLGLSLLAAPSVAQESAGSGQPFEAFDPARDDPAVLAGIAAEASREGTLPELRAWLDSLRVEGRAGRHALVYWGAISLERGIEPDTVATAFERHMAGHLDDSEALAAFVQVLEANAAIDQADRLRRGVPSAGIEPLVAMPERAPDWTGSPVSVATESLVAGIEEALRSGEPEEVRRALARAIAAGLPPARVALVRGDLHLARSATDSAIGAWASAVGAAPRPEALTALERVRLVHSLQRAGADATVLEELGRILLVAQADPRAAMARLDSLAGVVQSEDSAGVAPALLAGLAAEWVGEGGEPAKASRGMEVAARDAGAEGAGLLLAAGSWARAAEEEERARGLWREVVERYPGTPHDLEARRLLSEPGPGR